MASTTDMRLTYESYGDSSFYSYKFKLSNDDISIDFPHYNFSIGTDSNFTQLLYFTAPTILNGGF